MVGFENEEEALKKLGAKVIAISTDDEANAQKAADDVSFPVAHSATKKDADAMGGWWGEPKGILQPSEFVLNADGKVMSSSYSSGALGRIDAADVVKWLTRRESKM